MTPSERLTELFTPDIKAEGEHLLGCLVESLNKKARDIWNLKGKIAALTKENEELRAKVESKPKGIRSSRYLMTPNTSWGS